MEINIDGKECSAKIGETILQVAEKNYIDIPTLCHNDSIKPYGVCRLCVVELEERGRTRIVTSCNYEILKDNLIVRTDTEKIINIRKMIIELLLARCPEVEGLKKIAEDFGVKDIRFKQENDDCILCGLCVRACSEVVGRSALGFSYRGTTRKIGTPFFEQSNTCIGCGTCVQICPTHCIKMEDKDGKRILKKWNTELELVKCKICGNYFVPDVQLNYITETTGIEKEKLDVCLDCRR